MEQRPGLNDKEVFMSKKAVKIAIKNIGSQKKTAELLNVSQQYISNCVTRGYFPLNHAIKIADNSKIHPIHLINPEVERCAIDLVFPKDREPRRGDEIYQEIDSDHPSHPAFGLV